MLRLLTIACLALTCGGEFYSSVVELQKLLNTESVLLKSLESHIAARDEKTNSLRSLLDKFTREHVESASDDGATPGSKLSNPISAYFLVKRLSSDWRRTQAEIAAPTNLQGQVDMPPMEPQGGDAVTLPTDADLDAAASALLRLQDTYRLDIEALARGELNGVQYAAELDADACFELGRRAFFARDYYDAVAWMMETLARHDENTVQNVTDILGFIGYSRYKQGRYHEAMRLTEEMLALDPDHGLAQRNLGGYRELAAQTPQEQEQHVPRTPKGNAKAEIYKSLCRGDTKMDEATKAMLRCRYVDHGSPFLRLARLKEEEAFLSPRILLYHDVISHREADAIVEKAKTKLKPATVVTDTETIVMSTRLARNCWLTSHEVTLVGAVDRRAGHMTGLTTQSAEQLQITNYHVGGHYEPHCDFMSEKRMTHTFGPQGTGNRIATVMFYLNDVELGGATVFPQLPVTLLPVRGAAAVWFNLFDDGSGDRRTEHAGCPVLVGAKWVANKWFHEIGQEFLRPCGLVQDWQRSP